jgi:hypothetical protein
MCTAHLLPGASRIFNVVSRSPLPLLREPRSTVHRYDLLWRAIATFVRPNWNRILLQIAPIPSAVNMRVVAGTIQHPFVCKAFHQRHQKRPVTIGAAAKQVSRATFGALDAVANTGSHGRCQIRQIVYLRLNEEESAVPPRRLTTDRNSGSTITKLTVAEWTLTEMNPVNWTFADVVLLR